LTKHWGQAPIILAHASFKIWELLTVEFALKKRTFACFLLFSSLIQCSFFFHNFFTRSKSYFLYVSPINNCRCILHRRYIHVVVSACKLTNVRIMVRSLGRISFKNIRKNTYNFSYNTKRTNNQFV
jgi:hypothetical protein